MAQIPSGFVLESIRKLAGGARVTIPGQDQAIKNVDRVVKKQRNDWQLAWFTPDADHNSALLVTQQKLGEDQQWAEVYRAYHTLPGDYFYSLSYPYGGLKLFPRITVRRDVRADTVTPSDPGTACPIAAYSTAILVSQTFQETENPNIKQHVRVYDIVPVTADQIGFGYSLSYPYGGLITNPRVTWTFQITKATYAAAAPGSVCPIVGYAGAILISEKTQGSTEQDQIVNVSRIYDLVPAAATQQGFGYSIGYMNGDKDFPFLTWNFQIALASYAVANDLSACPITGFTGLLLVDQQLQGNNEQNQIVAVSRRFETLPGPLVHKITYDKIDVTKPIISTQQRIVVTAYTAGTPNTTTCPVAGFTTLKLLDQEMVETEYANVKSDNRVYQLLPGPTLVEFQWDQRIEAFVRIEKTIVTSVGMAPSLASNILTEYQQVDRWRSIQIVSKFDSSVIGTSTIKKIGVKYNFPAWVYNIAFVTAYTTDVDRLAVALRVDMRPGPSGTFLGTLTETVVTNLNSNDTPFLYKEVGGVIALAYAHGVTTDPKAVEASTWTVPPSLHAAIIPSLGSFTNVSSTVTGIDASSPTTPNEGATITTDVGMEVWRFGTGIKSVITIVVPDYSP